MEFKGEGFVSWSKVRVILGHVLTSCQMSESNKLLNNKTTKDFSNS